MTWINSISDIEYMLISTFLLLYVFYFIRIIIAARRLKTSIGSIIIKFIIRSAYFSLFIIALLGPSFGIKHKEIKSVGKDMYMAIDLSNSMNANDIQPSRLEKIKFELKNIVDAFHSDRVGLIIFSSDAFIQCPLTYDQDALHLFIETLNTNLVPNSGTDFGPPLEIALEKLNEDSPNPIQQKSKIIILISDGEDFGSSTNEAIQALNNAGIKLFVLGVGTERGSKIPVNDSFKKDHDGKAVITKLNSSDLKDLAEQTNGNYFEINENSNGVSRLINAVNNIEGELRDAKEIDVSSNKYFYFLLAAVILLILDFLIRLKVIKI